jgi:cell division protease FtsH
VAPQPPPDGSGPRRPEPPVGASWGWRFALLLTLLAWLWILGGPLAEPEGEVLSFSALVAAVDDGRVEAVTITADGEVEGQLTDGSAFTSAIPVALSGDALLERFEAHGVEVEARPSRVTFLTVLLSLAPLLLLIGFLLFIARRAGGQVGMASVGRARAKVVDAERPTTRFADVAGYEGVKREIIEVVDFLRRPERFRLAGAIAPRGVLMVGPPGTGKTFLARAVAGEAEVPFLSVTGSSFVEMFVGVGAARVRDLFAEARKLTPAIVFIDEIDAIGQRRSGGGAMVSHEEREQTLNQLLAEMDGFDPAEGIVVLAATNRPDVLDPALLRPGRFDRQVVVPLPTQAERAAILAIHARGKQLAGDVDLEVVARATPGFSGADLANLVNEAAMFAVREDRVVLGARDFDGARDRILLGLSQGANALLPDEQRAVAIHEAGHALVAALSEHADPVAKITILPAGQSLGATHQLPVDERHLLSEAYLRDALAVRLGGRAAELVVLGEGSTGAANDLVEATQLALRMVRDYGLSPVVGPVGLGSTAPQYLGGQELQHRWWAERTQRLVDAEVTRLLREAEGRALALLEAHRPALDQLTALLLERETLDGAVVHELAVRGVPALDDGLSVDASPSDDATREDPALTAPPQAPPAGPAAPG